MRQKFFNIMALVIFFLNGNLTWALEKSKVYDVASGSSPAIAVDNTGGLHIAYENPVTYEVAKAVRDSQGHLHSVEGSSLILPGIWYTQSGIGGEDKWTDPVGIPGLGGGSHQPAIGVDKNGTIDIVWAGSDSADKITDIFFTCSADEGHTWSKPIDIATTPGESSEPAIAIAPDNSIHVVWSDTSRGENHKDIYYTYSKDGGKTWGKNPLLPADDISNTTGQSSQSAIAIDKDGVIHVAWLDNTPGEAHPDIYYNYKAAGSWNQPADISNSSRMSSHPGIACGADGKVYISWGDNSRKEHAADVWCAIASEPGHFDRPINISSSPGISSEPVIAANETGCVAVVWSDTSNNPNKPDVYCRISNNGGVGFSSVVDLSHAAAVSKHPDVVIAGKRMLAAWEESDGANKQIKTTSIELKDIAMGPVLNVAPSIHLYNSR